MEEYRKQKHESIHIKNVIVVFNEEVLIHELIKEILNSHEFP